MPKWVRTLGKEFTVARGLGYGVSDGGQGIKGKQVWCFVPS